MKKYQVDIITMGCSKNLVDSEDLMRLFEANGYACEHDSKNPRGEIVVINTCGFIEDAKQESINKILEFANAKKEGRIKMLFVMGCLSQRYRSELEAEISEVDKFYGKFDYKQLLVDLGKKDVNNDVGNRVITTPGHYAYLKISEGCDRHCAYCAIPIITGRHKSRSKKEIIEEARILADKGVKEIQLIAQELTYYGVDIDGKRHIAELVDALSDISGIEWIRLHYAYPNDFPKDLLEVMAKRDNVCKYLDVALQHVSTPVLKKMRRNISEEETYRFVSELRDAVPGIALRTTMMVGFPDETEEDFELLMKFVSWARFERLGAFAYSEEDGTYGALHYRDNIPKEVKLERLDRLMSLQQNISTEIEASAVGTVQKVIIDRKEGDFYVGRTQYSSPEVDPEVLIRANNRRLRRGSFYQVLITGSEEFDLYGDVV